MIKDAGKWWEGFKLIEFEDVAVDESGLRYPAVLEAFKTYFFPPQYKMEQRLKFWALTFDEDKALTFIERYSSILLTLPNVPEEERWVNLYGHLTTSYRNLLDSRSIKNSKDAAKFIHQNAKAEQQVRKREVGVNAYQASNKRPKTSQSSTSSTSSKKDPKDAAREKVDITMANYNDFQAFPRLTPKLRAFLVDKKGCFRCRLLDKPDDHRSATCTSKPDFQKRK